MAFDWKKAALEEKQREHQTMRSGGPVFVAVGIVSTMAHFAIGHPEDSSSGLIMGSIGVLSFVISLVMRRRQRAAAPPAE